MAENTLSRVRGYTGTIYARARCKPELRYAMARLMALRGGTEASVTRYLLEEGLRAVGWPEERRVVEYARYSAQCITSGTTNEFEKARS